MIRETRKFLVALEKAAQIKEPGDDANHALAKVVLYLLDRMDEAKRDEILASDEELLKFVRCVHYFAKEMTEGAKLNNLPTIEFMAEYMRGIERGGPKGMG